VDPSHLRSIPLFASLTDEQARRIATFAAEDSVAAGATLLRAGDFANELIAIEDGTADVLRDGEKVAAVGPGDIVGEAGLIERRQRNATVVATSSMRLIRLTSWEIRRLPDETREELRRLARERSVDVPDAG
jgi:CRP-like cAMP-binding protein